ncbi:MAG: DegT/DnrJ/EryC1/StrS family aminotransferase [Candidatus Polarisedimenticolaceae bacterium]|nr:DegT/DnrJ/EryC1/StrS family aminotransferase [Candidatus Polarisedimenticolaceae bacterium]
MSEKPIFVTQPSLPPLEEFIPYLEEIWSNKILTNDGPFHKQLEKALCEYLSVDHISLFANGTLALVTALQALRVTGEVITTPYSFIATSHSLLWNGISPVFVDISPHSFNLDPHKIEAAITPKTTAILPVHCYGYPCEVDHIQKIADTYGLKVLYDAAHTFGVRDKIGGISRHGDLSILSFHATKVFNTFEGGAIICPDAKTKQRIDYLKNFGIVDETTVIAPGINGKMNEIQAAMGVLQLAHVDKSIACRQEIDRLYRQDLEGVDGITIPEKPNTAQHNFSYFPILIEPSFLLSRDALYENLKSRGIFSRRYFYPLITDFPMYRGLPSANLSNLPQATDTAQKVLCLPIYPSLKREEIESIIKMIKAHT